MIKKQTPILYRSSYRLQLHKDFRFQDAQGLIPYLSRLGISHLYLSPIFEATPGSKHGYDGTNPEKISEERGGEKEFLNLVKKIGRSSLDGIILDIVPNHLACNLHNPAWRDVLEKGRDSKFWRVFDIKTEDPKTDPIILPVLGKTLSEELSSGGVRLFCKDGLWSVAVYDSVYPLNKEAQTYLKEKYPNREDDIPLKVTKNILSLQFYHLKDWKTGNRSLNYRRFFDINELIGIRMEDPQVFRWFHKKTFELLKKYPEIQGLRIDHVDGLTFPSQYLKRLHRHAPAVWVEKILGDKEELPNYWPVLGSTGYEFSNAASRLFVNLPGLVLLQASYINSVDDRWQRFHECVYDSKMEILRSLFSAELKTVSRLFYDTTTAAHKKNFSEIELSHTIAEVTSALKVYRTYAKPGQQLDSSWLAEALSEVEGRSGINRAAFRWFKKILSLPGTWSPRLLLAIKRWEQLSGPVMAKGLEDTALYRYCPLLSLNGVGGEPDWLGEASLEFHGAQIQKLRKFKLGMNTSSTHDTKRSEDVLCRLNVLSELSEEWIYFIQKVIVTYQESLKNIQPRSIYFIVETVLGAWPFDGKITKDFIMRIQEYAIKASREAKLETSWAQVDVEYEDEVKAFIQKLLNPSSQVERKIYAEMRDFADRLSYFGAINSLSFLALKVLTPGIPDFYQGCEMWDLSLVDPDNRRPVDYEMRMKALHRIERETKSSSTRFLSQLTKEWRSGEIKLFVTWRLLSLRKRFAEGFLYGDYIPINFKGTGRSPFISFMRKQGDQWFWIILPRFLAKLEEVNEELRIQKILNRDMDFVIPAEAPRYWKNIFSQKHLDRENMNLQKIFGDFPIVVLRSEERPS